MTAKVKPDDSQYIRDLLEDLGTLEMVSDSHIMRDQLPQFSKEQLDKIDNHCRLIKRYIRDIKNRTKGENKP